MTREEASFILANIDRRVCDDELNDALDMAIKALEQEPMVFKSSVIMDIEKTEKCRQKIKEQIKEGIVLLPHYIDLISPQEPKIGRWINIKDTSWKGGGYWQCSNCKNGFAYDAYFEADEWEYCPKCGAKMEAKND